MKTLQHASKTIAVTAVCLLLGACASAPTEPAGAAQARSKLSQLQADPQLATRAPVAIKEAEAAVIAAEQPRSEQSMPQGEHLVYLADRKVDIAYAQAQTRLWEDQRKQLSEQREGARLASRTQEADQAHAKNDDLQRQIAELNAKETERGLVVTLGDVLFETGRSELKGNAANNLGKLAVFLNTYPDRSVIIEGYTDNVGTEDANFNLSQRRAESVRSYLISQGVAANRLSATGKGEGMPVASNASVSGRQLNRRVEVIITNAMTSLK